MTGDRGASSVRGKAGWPGRLILAATLIGTLWSAPAGASDPAPLLFLCDEAYPPITYRDGNQAKGLVVDVLRALERRIGRPIEIRMMPWQEAQSLVAEGKADGLCQMSITEARRRVYDFSDPIVTSRFSIFTAAGHEGLSELTDLRGLRVGVTAGGLPKTLVEADPAIRMVIIADYLDGFLKLRDGRLDAVIADQWVGTYQLAEHGLRSVRTDGDSIARLGSSIAVRKGESALLEEINGGLRSLRADGTLARITAAWRPKEVVFETREQMMRKIFDGSIGVLSVLLVISTLWGLTLWREIRRRRRTESILRDSERHLSDTVETLSRLNAELTRFATITSHDLQEPIRSIVSFSQLLQRHLGENLDADGREFLGFIVNGGRRMSDLIQDLLSYTKISNRQSPHLPLDLDRVAAAACDNLRALIDERGARLDIAPLPRVIGERILLIELFQNLINNAIKFTPADRSPQIRIWARRDGDHWCLAVGDHGIGISPEYHQRIFEIFQRLHTGSAYPGTGIGLALCQRIVEQHGGSIWVESEEGVGATFLFTLPAAEP